MRYDFCVIGGGIIGLASAQALLEANPGASLLLLEKEKELASHQTGHNSGVIHAGVYYKPGSLKARLCREGNRATKEFCAAEGIPFETCGKLIIATSAAEASGLLNLQERARANAIEVDLISGEELSALEPRVRGVQALNVPSTAIVDYRQVASALAGAVRRMGGQIVLGAKVTRIIENAHGVDVASEAQNWTTARLIACAGLQSDRLARLAGLKTDFRIIPFRGEYFVLPPVRSGIVSRLIYPVPDPTLPFLGVHITRMIDGSITLGPNAVLGLGREAYESRLRVHPRDVADYASYPGFWRLVRKHWRFGIDEAVRAAFKSRFLADCRRYIPELEIGDMLPRPAGIRAQAVGRDGRMIEDFLFLSTPRMLHVCNAPSPAATSAIPIGRLIAEKVRESIAS